MEGSSRSSAEDRKDPALRGRSPAIAAAPSRATRAPRSLAIDDAGTPRRRGEAPQQAAPCPATRVRVHPADGWGSRCSEIGSVNQQLDFRADFSGVASSNRASVDHAIGRVLTGRREASVRFEPRNTSSIDARTPSTACPKCGKPRLVKVPWGRDTHADRRLHRAPCESHAKKNARASGRQRAVLRWRGGSQDSVSRTADSGPKRLSGATAERGRRAGEERERRRRGRRYRGAVFRCTRPRATTVPSTASSGRRGRRQVFRDRRGRHPDFVVGVDQRVCDLALGLVRCVEAAIALASVCRCGEHSARSRCNRSR